MIDWEHLGPYLRNQIFAKTFSFPKFASAWKYQLLSSIHSWDTADFGVSKPKWLPPFPTNTMQKLLKKLLNFLNFYQHAKNKLTPLIPSWDTTSFSVLRPKWLHPFFDHAHANIFQSIFIFYESASYAKSFVLEIQLT